MQTQKIVVTATKIISCLFSLDTVTDGNNTYPRRIRRRSNLGHIFREKKCVLWAGKYGIFYG
jgi:hypothetical protein